MVDMTLDESKALGVDQVSKADYGKALEQNLTDLVKRVHRGKLQTTAKKKKELWMFIDPTESEFEEPRAGNPHAGICEGVILSSDRRRG